MKILVSSLVFHPDHSGIALYATDFARYAHSKGHTVKVVTGFPFYPQWKKRNADRRVLFREDKDLGFTVYRNYLYVPSTPTAFRRIIQEITFIIFSLISFFKAGKNDVIVVFTTPVLLGLTGVVFKKLFSSKLVINVQDFQIEAADSLGFLSKLPIISIMKILERISYNHADMVTSISDGMVNLLHEKGIEQSKLLMWPNWINVQEEAELGPINIFRKKHGIPEDTKIIGYAGNVGVKQGLSILIDIAEIFKQSSNVLFLIIGEGGDLANLKQYSEKKNLPNLRFLPFLNSAEYKQFLADADVIFVSQKKIPKDIYFPSKLLGLMAASKLIFLAADKDSELYKVISQNKLGIVSDINDFEHVIRSMEMIIKNEGVNDFRYNARKFVEQYDQEVVLNNVLKTIESIIKK